MPVVRDENRIPSAVKELRKLFERRADVGVFSDAPKLVSLATMNEFGVNIPVSSELARRLRALAREYGVNPDLLPREGEMLKIPERSFLRSTFDEKEHEIAAGSRELVKEVMLGRKDAYSVLRELGEQLQQAVIERVRTGEGLAPNHPLTVAIKGHNRPLIGETGVFETTKGIRLRVVRR